MLRSWVSCRISWYTDTYWTERRWQILNKKREISKASRSILNYLLRLIEVHYINMNTAEPEVKGLSDIRFASIIFLFRSAGISVKMKNISTIYVAYMITVITCSFSTFIGMFADVYVHWDDLGSAMTSIRALFPLTNVMWIFSCCRWVATLGVTYAV
jgi:hypothetical protein